jgi:hypothetical protein
MGAALACLRVVTTSRDEVNEACFFCKDKRKHPPGATVLQLWLWYKKSGSHRHIFNFTFAHETPTAFITTNNRDI